MLADIAVHDQEGFAALATVAKEALAAAATSARSEDVPR